MNIRLGKLKTSVPKVQEEVVEKYNTPVLTMYPTPTQPKERYKFNLNKAAMELFQGVDVEFGFTTDTGTLLNNIIIAAVPLETGNKINALGNFFSKQAHEDIIIFTTSSNVPTTTELEFNLFSTDTPGFYELGLIVNTEIANSIMRGVPFDEDTNMDNSHTYFKTEFNDVPANPFHQVRQDDGMNPNREFATSTDRF